MKRIKVKPSEPGLKVLDDMGRQIPAEGKEVKNTIHIRRRIKDGSLEVMKSTTASSAPGRASHGSKSSKTSQAKSEKSGGKD